MRKANRAGILAYLVFSNLLICASALALSANEVQQLAAAQSKGECKLHLTKINEQAAKINEQAIKNNEQAAKIQHLSAELQRYKRDAEMKDLGEDGGSLLGRRGGGLATSGSFTLSSGSNTAGNDESLALSNLGEGASGSFISSVKRALRKASVKAMTTASDPGGPARCKQVNEGTAPGLLNCKPMQHKCVVAKWTKSEAKCKKAWGGKVSCPDGISSKGVFLSFYCVKWSSDSAALGQMEVQGSQASAGGLIATKALAKHVHWMSQYSGVLLMKRAVCKNNKCAVYKSGLCIDVGKKVWSHFYNHKIKDPKGEAMMFAKEAEKLLVQYKNVLPEKHLCSDTRHKYTCDKNTLCKHKGEPLKDAAKGKTAVLLF